MNLKSLACSAVLAVSTALPASAADFVRPAPAHAQAASSVCSDSSVLGVIDHNFDYRDAHYLHAGLDITDFHGAHEIYYRPSDATHLVGRTYCEATVVMNDNRRRPVWYLIESTMGFAGIGDNVEYCVAGLDPWHVHGSYCASVRP